MPSRSQGRVPSQAFHGVGWLFLGLVRREPIKTRTAALAGWSFCVEIVVSVAGPLEPSSGAGGKWGFSVTRSCPP